MKQFFLQDEELHNRDDDFFRHDDLANNIRHILFENIPPYNIAVIGKWGLGKSSLINLALEEFRHSENYLCVNINAWKYEKEVLGRVFLRQVLHAIQDKPESRQEKAKKSFLDMLKGIGKNNKKTGIGKYAITAIKRYWLLGVVYIAVSGILYSIYKLVQCQMNPDLCQGAKYFWGLVFTGYLKNSATLLLVPSFLFLLTNFVLDFKKNPLYRIGFQLPEMNVEDYEDELLEAIEEKYPEGREPKIIITLDDLDRLGTEKMIEAIDAIKVFINFKNCVFIVPFDEKILRDAFQEQRMTGMTSSYYSEGEHLIDKLFQYKIYLNPPLVFDIKKYARTLCEDNLGPFFAEYQNEKLFMKAIERIVIYPDITTPRQVKKLINNFISYLIIARKRESIGKMPEGFSTSESGVFSIAKLSVLQANFGEFYIYLFEDDEAIEKLLEANTNPELIADLPEGLKRLLEINNYNTIPETATPLISFLSYTRNFGRDNLLSYLYITEDDIALQTGSKAQQDFIHAAVSNNVTECVRLLDGNSKLALAAENYIRYGTDPIAVVNIVSTMTLMADNLLQGYRQDVANAIAERAEDIASYWDEENAGELNEQGLFSYYKITDNKDGFGVILTKYLDVCRTEEGVDDTIEAYVLNGDVVNDTIWNKVQAFIKTSFEDGTVDCARFIELRHDTGICDSLWLNDYLQYLVAYLKSSEDYSSVNVNELEDIYQILFDSKKGKTFDELSPIFDSGEMTDVFVSLLQAGKDNYPDNKTLCSLIIQQIGSDETDKEKVNKLLAVCRYKMKGTEDLTALDEYFDSQCSSPYMPDMLKTYLDNNQIDGIPNAVSSIIAKAFSEKLESEIEAAKVLIGTKNSAIMDKVSTKLTEAVKHNRTEYKGIAELLCEFYRVDSDRGLGLIQGSVNNLPQSDVTDSYIEFVSRLFEMADKKDDNIAPLQDSMLSALVARYKAGNNKRTIIDVFSRFSDCLRDEDFTAIEAAIYKSVDEDNIGAIYTLFKAKRKHFFGEGSTLSLSHYSDICLRAMETAELKNDAIRNLKDKFEWIGDIPRIANQVNVVGADNELAISCCDKFISKKINSEDRYKDAVHNVCEIIEMHDASLMEELLSEPAEIMMKAVEIITSSPDEYGFEEVICIWKWMMMHLRKKDVLNRLADIISILTSKSSDREQGEEVIGMLENIPVKTFRDKKEKFIPVFVELIKKRYGSEFDERLLGLAKDRGIGKKVLAQAPASLEEELKELA